MACELGDGIQGNTVCLCAMSVVLFVFGEKSLMKREGGGEGRRPSFAKKKRKRFCFFKKKNEIFTEEDREFKNIKCSDCTNCSDIRWS